MHDPPLRATGLSRARPASSIIVGVTLLVLAALLESLLGRASRPEHWLAGALAATSLVTGLLMLRRAPVAALLVAVLFLGGIGQLWMTEPDYFSEFKPRPRELLDIAMLALLALEAIVSIVALANRRYWARLRPALASPETGWRLVALLGLTAITSTSLLRYIGLHDPLGYAWRLVAVGVISAMHIGMVAAIAAAPDLPRLRLSPHHAEAWSRRLPLLLAAAVTLIAAWLAYAAFRRVGLVEDETAYLFQARTFAGGLLMAPPLPIGTEPSFHFYLLQNTAAGWYATTSPGFPAVLALGVLVGAPWLVNPLLGGLAVLLAHRFVLRWSDRWTANLVALLMACSPWLLETSASLMTHALSLVLIAGGWLLLSIAHDRQAAGRGWSAGGMALAAGLLMGWLFVNRSLEGLLIGGLSGLWLVWTMRVAGWRAIVLYGAGCIAAGVLVFAYNAAFTGSPMVTPLQAYLDVLWGPHGNDFGFGKDVGPPTNWGDFDLWHGHSLEEGLLNTLAGLRMLNLELFGWLTGSLLLVWVWLLWGRADRSRAGGLARLMAVVALAVISIHVF